jgi:hypothetical protein
MRAIAINVGANTNEPGFRGPVRPDGTFEYIPIPESEPAINPPTYGDLAPHLDTSIPAGLLETPVHLDPTFSEYPLCDRYTYGDEHGIKAGPLSTLTEGDYVFFYATLSVEAAADWLPPAWGAFIIGQFRLARDALTGEEYAALDAEDAAPFETNAHVRRETTDSRVYLLGDSAASSLYDRALPLSRPTGGTDASRLVSVLSSDSGRGPWWRRPLRYDATATRKLLALHDAASAGLSKYHS